MIVNLKVSNFKGIKNAEVKCNKITLFVGGNMQGKTSLLTSIGWALSGENRPNLVTNGADKASVSLETERAMFNRTYLNGSKSSKINITKKSDGSSVDPKNALSSFNTNCFDPIQFIFMDNKSQSKIVRDALASKMVLTQEEIDKYKIINKDENGNLLLDDAKTLCEKTYKKYYDQRTEVNRQVDLMSKKMKSIDIASIPTDEEILKLEEEVNKLSQKLQEQIMHNARVEAAKRNANTALSLKSQLEILENEIKKVDSAIEVDHDALSHLADLKRFLTEQRNKEAAHRAEIKVLKETVGKLNSGSEISCPIGLGIKCKTDMSDHLKAMSESIEKASEELKSLYRENISMSENIDEMERRMSISSDFKKKVLERDRTKSMLESLTINAIDFEDDSITKSKLEEGRSKLSTIKLAKEIMELGDYEKQQLEQFRLDNLVKGLKLFIDNELTKRAVIDVPNIEVKNDGIYYKGILLSEECTSIQLRAACALMRFLFPKNKLILTDKLEALDRKSLVQFLNRFSKDSDVQLIGTYVSDQDDFNFLKEIENIQIIHVKNGVPTIV